MATSNDRLWPGAALAKTIADVDSSLAVELRRTAGNLENIAQLVAGSLDRALVSVEWHRSHHRRRIPAHENHRARIGAVPISDGTRLRATGAP